MTTERIPEQWQRVCLGSDNVAADLITDGCNMGVKSLFKYLNQYKAADEKSKKLAKKLISIEEDLSSNLRKFL